MQKTKDSVSSWSMPEKQKLIWCYVRGWDIDFISRSVLQRPKLETAQLLEDILSGETKFRAHWGRCLEAFPWTDRQDEILHEVREYGLRLKTVCHILARSPLKIKKRWRQIKDG